MTEPFETIPRMETIRTLAEQSGVPYSRIRSWCIDGTLPYIRSGNRYLISVKAFTQLIIGGEHDRIEEQA